MKQLQLLLASIIPPSGVRGRYIKPIFCLLVLLLATTLVAHADSGVPDPGGDPNAPIDGGLSLLVAAGVGYGAKKLKQKRTKEL